jgi:hypothetical protein
MSEKESKETEEEKKKREKEERALMELIKKAMREVQPPAKMKWKKDPRPFIIQKAKKSKPSRKKNIPKK